MRRAATVIAVSDYLRRELEAKVPGARGKTEVVDSGVDLERFPVLPAPERTPAFVCIGSLSERKNVVRLARAFERFGEGELTFVGDGPLRAQLEGRERVHVVGRVPHDEIPTYLARASVVCQPSLLEPLGQALLEGMATGRSVVATRIGGPPEFVPSGAGVLVDPLDEESIADGLRQAAGLPDPEPGRPRGGRGARPQAAGELGWRRSWSEPLEVGEPDLHERPDGVLEPRLARGLERLLVALPHLCRVDALFQPVVARDEELVDPLPRLLGLHIRSVTVQIAEQQWPGVRVLIADDHRLFAEALEAILAGEDLGSRSSPTPATAARRSSSGSSTSPT